MFKSIFLAGILLSTVALSSMTGPGDDVDREEMFERLKDYERRHTNSYCEHCIAIAPIIPKPLDEFTIESAARGINVVEKAFLNSRALVSRLVSWKYFSQSREDLRIFILIIVMFRILCLRTTMMVGHFQTIATVLVNRYCPWHTWWQDHVSLVNFPLFQRRYNYITPSCLLFTHRSYYWLTFIKSSAFAPQ